MIHPICLPFLYFRFFLAEIQNVSGSMNAESIMGCIIRHTYNLPTWGENIRSAFIGEYSKDVRNSIPINGTNII